MKLIAISISLLFTFSHLIAHSQDYDFKYYLDAGLNSCEPSKAVLLGKARHNDGLVLLDCYNVSTGNLVMSAHFNDSSLAVLQGRFRSFYRNGNISQEGDYLDGYEHGVWNRYDSTGRLVDSAVYDRGNRVRTGDISPDKSARLLSNPGNNVSNSKYNSFLYYTKGRKIKIR